MEQALVTRQLGLSSIANHVGFTQCIRKIVDCANRLRFCCLELICLYFTIAGNTEGHNVHDLDSAFVDSCFRLLVADEYSSDVILRSAATSYRSILEDEGFELVREGCLTRICQSFRSNIITAISSGVNYIDSILNAYLCKKYDITPSNAKLLTARLGSCKSCVEKNAREVYFKKLKADEHRLLERSNGTADELHALLVAQTESSNLTFYDERIQSSFNSAYPLPEGENWQSRWQTEFDLLPDSSEFQALFKNRFRMVAYAEKAVVSPLAGFSADFVPFDKETLRMALEEMERGRHGASLEFQSYLKSHPRDDKWGLNIAFNKRKLKQLYTHKHNIDGQILTDGVRVIFPLRTHASSQLKTAGGKASGFARSEAGKAALVDSMLTEDEAFEYHAASGLIAVAGTRATMREEKMYMIHLKNEILLTAKTEKNIRAKIYIDDLRKRKRDEEKRQRETQTAEQRTLELNTKKLAKKKKIEDPWVHIQPPAAQKNPLIVGIDTGHVNPLTWASKRYHDTSDSIAEIGHVTLGNWYTMTGQRKRTRVLNKKIKNENLTPLPSAKTVNVTLLIQTLRARIQNYTQYTSVYGSILARRLSFDCYIKKQKTLVDVGRRLVKETDAVLAWGDGDFAHTRRGLSTGVGKTIERFIKTKYPRNVVITPEYRSSCICFNCGLYVQNCYHGYVKRKNGQLHRTNQNPKGAIIAKKIHGLLQCTSKACHTRWNRDVNGALNIRKIFISICQTRFPPLHYQRSFTKAALMAATHLASGRV